jgi:hypothetical protein
MESINYAMGCGGRAARGLPEGVWVYDGCLMTHR